MDRIQPGAHGRGLDARLLREPHGQHARGDHGGKGEPGDRNDHVAPYTVTYDGNGNSAGAVPIDGNSYNSGDTVTVVDNTGYLLKINVDNASFYFTGWNTAADGTGTTYAAGTGAFTITSDVTLYAQWTAYAVGGVGPAGGWVFYDAGDYKTYGWRYMEAGPEDLDTARWGAESISTGATGTVIGTGADNTESIVTNDTTTGKAADECGEYSIVKDGVTFDDWFLPSLDELDLMCSNLYMEGLGGFADEDYWSSSDEDGIYAREIYFPSNVQLRDLKEMKLNVRPVRYF